MYFKPVIDSDGHTIRETLVVTEGDGILNTDHIFNITLGYNSFCQSDGLVCSITFGAHSDELFACNEKVRSCIDFWNQYIESQKK